VRTLVLVLLLVVPVTGAAGCGGSDGKGTQTSSSALPAAEPAAGEVLSQFVEAAGAADAEGMWSLLSLPSQGRLGPEVEDFAAGYATRFRDGLGTFAGTSYEVVLSVATMTGWGVAAIAGDRVRDGEEEFATYAAALRREGDGWKLELDAPVNLRRVEPEGTTTSDPEPRIVLVIEAETAIEEAGLWLDGKPLTANVRGSDGRQITLEALPRDLSPGRHSVVVFGRTGDLAAAGSTPLTLAAADTG
jgi:hypothetical protein